MQNFVQRVFVGKASGGVSTVSAIGTAQTTPATLQIAGQPLALGGITVGDLYLLDETGLVMDVAAATAAVAGSKARVIRGVTNGKVSSGSLITKGLLSTKYTFQDYSAPVAQVSTFTNILSTLKANTQYQLQVVIPQDLPLISNRQDRIVVSLFTGATDGNVADLNRLVTNFNKQRDTLNIITASTDGVSLILTGKTIPTVGIADYEFVRFDTNFVTITAVNTVTNIPYNLTFKTAIQATTTAAVGGKGVPVQVRQLERVALGYAGFTSPREQWFRGPFPYGAVDGVQYCIYNVQQQISGEAVLQNSKTYPVSTLVAMSSGSNQTTGFGGILDAFIGYSGE